MHRPRLSGGPRDLVQELECSNVVSFAQDYLVLKKLANDCADENAETSI